VKTGRGRGRRSHPPDHAAHYTRARPQRLKRRARDAKTAASTVEHLMPRSLVKQGEPSSGTDSWLGIKLGPRAGTSVRRSPRGPPETKWSSRTPTPRSTLERHEPLALDNVNPRRDIGVRRSPRDPLETKRAPLAPMPRKTLEWYEPLAQDDISPLRDIGVRRSPRGPSKAKQAPRAPMTMQNPRAARAPGSERCQPS
jgi:hypothetical protein